MILIADSGATKTDWYISDSKNLLSTIGLNPNFIEADDVFKAIHESIISDFKEDIITVYFYGAGCGSQKGRELINSSLTNLFPNALINVDTDLLGAGRSLIGNDNGIVAILGTGSNSAVMNNGRIINNHPSLGYILGDEGSGCYLGKKFIGMLYNGLLPGKIQEQFETKFNYSLQDIISRVYKEKFPNRFLASFTQFLGENINDVEIRKLIKSGISDFFEVNLLKYPGIDKLPVRFTGSVSFYFSDIIKEIGNENGVNIDKIEKQPMAGLIRYHCSD